MICDLYVHITIELYYMPDMRYYDLYLFIIFKLYYYIGACVMGFLLGCKAYTIPLLPLHPTS